MMTCGVAVVVMARRSLSSYAVVKETNRGEERRGEERRGEERRGEERRGEERRGEERRGERRKEEKGRGEERSEDISFDATGGHIR